MRRESESDVAVRIVDVVVQLLETQGYDAVHLRTVAGLAHVSLARIYKLFHTRDELIAAALERWMTEHAYGEVAPPTPDEPLRDVLIRVLRSVFQPWEQHPHMLEAYHHARSGAGGDRLDAHGLSAIMPIAEISLRDLDPEYLEDVAIILPSMAVALIGQFASGALEVTEILPILERTVRRLTADNAAAAASRTPAGGGLPHATVSNSLRRAAP
ncbi:TetR family transcriptional regulator [Nocardia stercoris]|uniref:TetR/AcrR family transcriptional regulator n=1 Tax=Nocardia stercoris TaxID=2483361 RepID=A0A3M2L8L1_9NOCA|nr:TetR family transcriptional regulator [Nocardia stercoris]RMI33376.1 TetR/AcrR family transcriptional regulator [Nocardia stercoris]